MNKLIEKKKKENHTNPEIVHHSHRKLISLLKHGCCASYKGQHVLEEGGGHRVFKQRRFTAMRNSTAEPLGIFSPWDQRAQEEQRVSWSDTNDQDGRTQLISDTEMFNGVKVLL